MNFKAYPLTFHPIFKERIWGGNRLNTILNKEIVSNSVGESWEISTVKGDISIVRDGFYKDYSLTSLIESYPHELLGNVVHQKFGKQFPLLFKYIDAKQDLSVQVHPNDVLAQERHKSFGKTEMWYIMNVDPGSRLIVGFKEHVDAKKYAEHVKNKTLLSILEQISVAGGDVFLLETGTVHAIGAGIMLAEIQQTSDITYRIYDWDRVDPSTGKGRELHTDLALDAINYNKIEAQKKYNRLNEDIMVHCPYFTTNYLPLEGSKLVKKNGNTFTVYMCVSGNFSLFYDNTKYDYEKGDTVLVPAMMQAFEMQGEGTLLEIFIS